MEPEKEFQDREDKRKQLFLNQKQLLDTFLDMGEALTTRSGFARPENGTYGAMGGARANALPLPYYFLQNNFYKIIKKVLTNEITYAIMLSETRERTIDHRR